MRGFIEELRHRNVFRVGVAYVVTGWLIIMGFYDRILGLTFYP